MKKLPAVLLCIVIPAYVVASEGSACKVTYDGGSLVDTLCGMFGAVLLIENFLHEIFAVVQLKAGGSLLGLRPA